MDDIFRGFQDIARLAEAETRSVSAENPTGEKSGGAQASPGDDPHCADAASRLGKGWKVRPCVRNIRPDQTVTIADIKGPGVVQHIWCTVPLGTFGRLTLRVRYDDQSCLSVECPLGDFFANGVDGLARVNSLPICVYPRGGMNAYWPMPFRKRLLIDIVNDSPDPVSEFFYQITYACQDVPDDSAYFHASWRQSVTTRDHPEHTMIDGIAGRGHYVGTYLRWNQHAQGWWGEGEVKFFIDGDATDAPTICGTGTEDYFGGAWGFVDETRSDDRPATYTGPFLGYPQTVSHQPAPPDLPIATHALYRWHIPDPIRFKRDLFVTVQALGWEPDETYRPLTDEIASVAYWYQALPSQPLKPMLPFDERFARSSRNPA